MLLICMLCGCKTEEVTEQQVSTDGFSMTLPAEMDNLHNFGYYTDWEMAYGYGGTEVLVMKEDYAIYEELGFMPTALEYAEMIALSNGAEPVYIRREAPGTVYFELSGEGERYSYYAAVYQGTDAYWTVYISCPTVAFHEMEDEFMTYLESGISD